MMTTILQREQNFTNRISRNDTVWKKSFDE